jgi:Flp pilus assembly protein TadG
LTEHGAAGIEFVLVLGTMIVLIFGAIEMGLLYFAHSVVAAAANEGASTASAGGGTKGDAELVAEHALASLGKLAKDPSVQVTAGGGEVTVRASAMVPSIVPFLPAVAVEASAVMRQEVAVGGGG